MTPTIKLSIKPYFLILFVSIDVVRVLFVWSTLLGSLGVKVKIVFFGAPGSFSEPRKIDFSRYDLVGYKGVKAALTIQSKLIVYKEYVCLVL